MSPTADAPGARPEISPPARSSSWLATWTPEDPAFWAAEGRRRAWRTLALTTITLVLSFSTWFVMSVIAVRLPQIGFKFDTMQLFWLAAMPGLAGGSLRIVHTFLIPIFGTRAVISVATLLKIVPCVGIAFAVTNPETPFWLFMVLAFLAGFGGGDFSSYMPSTSLFFPKRLQGTALGIQAGVGNFGVSLTQFVTPWIIGFAAFGSLGGGSQTFVKGAVQKPIWLQNAVVWYVPLLLVLGIAAWALLRSVPVKASFREQLDIFRNKHTWSMTWLYVMTFGSFSGYSAAFPLMIKTIYGKFPDAPDPLAYAFYGPLIGSTIRVLMGPPSDSGKRAGSILTALSGLGLVGCALAVTRFVNPTSMAEFPYFVASMLGLFFFSGIGNASTFRQIPIIFSHSPRQGASVLGWTGAIAAYGPFAFSSLIGAAMTQWGSASHFFYGAIAFYAVGLVVNFWYYLRPGAEVPC